MGDYRQYIKTKVVGTDTLVIDGYTDWQTDKYDPADIQLSGTFPRQFQIQLVSPPPRSQCLYKLVSGAMTARTQAELDTEWAARPIPPDPDIELSNAINASLTLDDLKKALIGTNGKLAKAVGKLK